VSPVKYELGFYIPEDDILHINRREHLKSDNTEFLKNICSFELPDQYINFFS
jgi:hypothetical protein